MGSVERMITGLADYTLADLEALENERPELGRLEVIDGALHATGESAVGNLHQLIVQRLFLLFVAACPPTRIVRVDTWWKSPRGKIRPDLAVYRPDHLPQNRRGAFQVPPQVIVEVLSADEDHDLVKKDGVYAQFGVARRAYIESWGRHPWWCRVDGTDHAEAEVDWQLDGGPPLRLRRDELLGD